MRHAELVGRLFTAGPDPVSTLARAAEAFAAAIPAREAIASEKDPARRHIKALKYTELAQHPDNPLAGAELEVRVTRAALLAAIEYAVLRGVTFTPAESRPGWFDEP